MPEEWITTAEAADLLGISARQVRERVRQGKLKAKREGSKWLIHSSLEAEEAEVGEPPSGGRSEEERRLAEVEHLREQMQEKDRQIQEKDKQIEALQTQLADASQRHDTIVLQLTRQLEQSQRLLEYHQDPWYRRWFRRNRGTEGETR